LEFEASTDGPILISDQKMILPVQFFGEPSQVGIYHSNDGGDSWEFISFLPGLGKIDFAPQSNGFFWSNTELFTSRDDGITWESVQQNMKFDGELVLMDFKDSLTGWALFFENEKTVLYKTIDGGFHWERLSP
jgi:photosystem II stability/assembly factor-like uncharacterized protein